MHFIIFSQCVEITEIYAQVHLPTYWVGISTYDYKTVHENKDTYE